MLQWWSPKDPQAEEYNLKLSLIDKYWGTDACKIVINTTNNFDKHHFYYFWSLFSECNQNTVDKTQILGSEQTTARSRDFTVTTTEILRLPCFRHPTNDISFLGFRIHFHATLSHQYPKPKISIFIDRGVEILQLLPFFFLVTKFPMIILDPEVATATAVSQSPRLPSWDQSCTD